MADKKPPKLTTHEKALIIQLLEQRRIYFESRNYKTAKEMSELILKVHELL